MNYSDFLHKSDRSVKTKCKTKKSGSIEPLFEQTQSPVDMLRSKGFKIKLVTPTTFGTQIDFAKKYEEKDLQSVLNGYNIKIKDKSIFIVD